MQVSAPHATTSANTLNQRISQLDTRRPGLRTPTSSSFVEPHWRQGYEHPMQPRSLQCTSSDPEIIYYALHCARGLLEAYTCTQRQKWRCSHISASGAWRIGCSADVPWRMAELSQR